ncbi:beta-galactosidase [Pedobacter frigoris]|uniref:Glycoside hydrolase family 42 N-terminal domain-containing protein n=1 Tax=Pedobacter frigoris TaxID=2571272 RepID=A0A4U1CLT5_9SPHI|nr:beta-galactosidase [Pedobacter frigoris]TKC06170.1 hypothetical protein FA047_12660 [Pedobacter frigoris]
MKYTTLPLLFLLVFCACKKPTENQTPPTEENREGTIPPSKTRFSQYLEINAFEWNFAQFAVPERIDEAKFSVIKSFSGVRHYLDWGRIEQTEGKYTFNPAHTGGWGLDVIYQRLKDEGMDVLLDLKTCPDWLVDTYPENQRDAENVPAPYGLDRANPASYIAQAKAAFQLAARYGSNKNVDPKLVSVITAIRWTGDTPNAIKIGLGLIKYIECDNERDKWWKGPKAEQSAEEYAANMSAFYDGNKGKLGKNVGVKSADPNMMVVMGGLSRPDPNFVIKMIAWCKKNRGTKADGSVDLCFDIINYHFYSNNASTNEGNGFIGVAPELSDIGDVADKFLKMSKEHANNMPVWMTETGYDINPNTPQRAIPIGSKNVQVTQADWNLRTSFLYARKGIKKCIFYMLDDVDVNSSIQYSSSGFVNADFSKRPAADYVGQTKKLLGNYYYDTTISTDPFVDLYKLDKKEIYALMVPDQTGRTTTYELNLGTAKQAVIHSLQIGKDEMSSKTVNTVNGKLKIEVTETPVFVEKVL